MPETENIYYFAYQAENHDKKRPPVILIHGAGGNHLSWPPQIRRLDGQRIYAIDLPGHGRSGAAGRQSIDEYVEDVAAFMNALKIRAAILVGISMGSAIALQLALKYPKKVKGLGLFGGGAKLRVAPIILETIGNANSFESAVDMVNESCFSAHAPASLMELSKKYMMAMRPPVLLGDFLACNEFDVTSQLEKINIPTLIICGTEDRMTPLKLSEALRDGLVNSQFHIMDHSGHMVILEQPDASADLLKKFIDALPLRVPAGSRKRIIPNGTPDPDS